MPKLTRDDGAEIHWEQRGEGPLVILAPYWNGHPSSFDALAEDLVRDHTVVRYDARGTGGSSSGGPHDMETGAGDLEAVAAAAGGGATIIGLADGGNWAVRVADRSPGVAPNIVALGGPPFALSRLAGMDAMIASDSVIEAFLEMLSNSYRGGMRTLLEATNAQMDEEELLRRLDKQVEHTPRETALGRVAAWRDDDPVEFCQRIGDRLTVVYSEDVAGPWLPPSSELEETFFSILPEARFVEVDDGMISRPDLTAGVIRELTSKA